MKEYIYPLQSEWDKLIERPTASYDDLEDLVSNVFEQIKTRGDDAIFEYTNEFDKVQIHKLQVDKKEILDGVNNVSKDLKNAIQKADKSDLILILSDNENFDFTEIKKSSKTILIHTKSDLGKLNKKNVHEISVKENTGIDKLIKMIVKHLKSLEPKENALLTRERHVQAVKRASDALKRASLSNLNINPELAAEDLRVAATAIGSITNNIDVEEILDDIFSSFCIGK